MHSEHFLPRIEWLLIIMYSNTHPPPRWPQDENGNLLLIRTPKDVSSSPAIKGLHRDTPSHPQMLLQSTNATSSSIWPTRPVKVLLIPLSSRQLPMCHSNCFLRSYSTCIQLIRPALPLSTSAIFCEFWRAVLYIQQDLPTTGTNPMQTCLPVLTTSAIAIKHLQNFTVCWNGSVTVGSINGDGDTVLAVAALETEIKTRGDIRWRYWEHVTISGNG